MNQAEAKQKFVSEDVIGGSSGIIDRYLNFGVRYRSFNVCCILLLVPLIFVVPIWQGDNGCHSLKASNKYYLCGQLNVIFK